MLTSLMVTGIVVWWAWPRTDPRFVGLWDEAWGPDGGMGSLELRTDGTAIRGGGGGNHYSMSWQVRDGYLFVGSAGYWAVGSPLREVVDWSYRVRGVTGSDISGSPMRILEVTEDAITLNSAAVGSDVTLHRHREPSAHDEIPSGNGFF